MTNEPNLSASNPADRPVPAAAREDWTSEHLTVDDFTATNEELLEQGKGKPHSTLGIASFIICALASTGLFLLFAIAALVRSLSQSPPATHTTPLQEACVMLYVILNICLFIAMFLGIASLFQKTHNKLYGLAGIELSGILFHVFLGAALIGWY